MLEERVVLRSDYHKVVGHGVVVCAGAFLRCAIPFFAAIVVSCGEYNMEIFQTRLGLWSALKVEPVPFP